MKKIGLLTFYIGQNYGGLLQAWALCRELSCLGDARIIQYHHPWSRGLRLNDWRSYVGKTPKKTILKWRELLRQLRRRRHFARMENLFEVWEPNFEDQCERLTQLNDLDVYVTGSDQVWNCPRDAKSFYFKYIKPYFLPFAPKGAKKIAYAASLGGCEYFGGVKEYVKHSLSSFDFISVRESNGVSILSRILPGKEIAIMPDPTILCGVEGFQSLLCDNCRSTHVGKDLFYLLGTLPVGQKKVLWGCCSKNSFNISVQDFRIGKGFDSVVDVPEFVANIRDARTIITNSFHGAVFSVLYHKPFAYIAFGDGVADKRNQRVLELLKLTGLDFAHFVGNVSRHAIERALSCNEDWMAVDERLNLVRTNAREWLKRAVE